MVTSRGFLLGKFMPLHNGHIFLCDVACSLVDELTVLVCTRDCEPIDGKLRYRWVRESLKKNARVVHLHRDVPQEPADHPDFWAIWKQIVEEHHPERIDMVFGSEDYVLHFADILAAAPFIVDAPRTTVPISSTEIRNSPRANWKYVPPAVRPFYQQRVCILGPESTGKSVLCETLAEDYGTLVVPEYGRAYDAYFKQGKGWKETDFCAIAEGHGALSTEMAKRAGYLLLEDTDLLQTIVWAEYLLGKPADTLLERLGEFSAAQHYLLLSPDVEWIDDGTRYSSRQDVRDWFFNRLLSLLEELNVNFNVISGDWPNRHRKARSIIARVLE